MITVTITDPIQLLGASAAAARADADARAAYLSAHPADPEATGYTPVTAQTYLQQRVEGMCRGYRDDLGPDRVTSSEFLLRFAPAELAAILTAAGADPVAAAMKERLTSSAFVWLASAEVQQAMAYCVAGGLLTPERMAAILAY